MTTYTWEDVANPAEGTFTKEQKEEIAKIWNARNEKGGELEQLEAQEMRAMRDAFLQQTDWTQGRDVVLSSDAAWKTYRQALRDLPKHAKWPHLADSDWPTKPS
tara:strand:+ start:192 stop:503 length:312 start_codon:yes stop_codon:yes gene_type:complete